MVSREDYQILWGETRASQALWHCLSHSVSGPQILTEGSRLSDFSSSLQLGSDAAIVDHFYGSWEGSSGGGGGRLKGHP